MAEIPDPFLAFIQPSPDVPEGPAEQQPAPLMGQIEWIDYAIMAVGALIAVPALLSLLGSSHLVSLRYVAAGAAAELVLLELAYIALGVGLMLRKEIARRIYVVLAVIGVLFALVGTVGYFHDRGSTMTTAGVSTLTLDQGQVTQLQTRIAQVNAETNMTPAIRAATLAALNQQLSNAQQYLATAASPGGVYGGLVFAWVLALGPLMLLTRPAVKSRFS